tara:strand:+ start:524 stop:673 length:150 start_codon:yes stop_codon:yes gene_type:complete
MKKEPSIELIDNLLIEGTKHLKEEFGAYHPFYLKVWVNKKLKQKGYKII